MSSEFTPLGIVHVVKLTYSSQCLSGTRKRDQLASPYYPTYPGSLRAAR
jgi:hypothetical protein